MTPERFLTSLKRQGPAAAVLFLGTEAHQRSRCRRALLESVLPQEEQESGVTRYDLSEASLAEMIDDARSMSLFSSRRVILGLNSEGVLPRGKSEEAEPASGGTGDAGILAAYLKDPSPGVVLLFEATRFDFEGEDKKKLERVRKFFSAISETVEFRRFSSEEAWAETQTLARAAGVRIEPAAIAMLVESLAADVAHIEREMEKLALYAGPGHVIGEQEILAMVPDARSASIFELVNALGRRDRARALSILDTLSREGEYLPLALSFLAAQFRFALAAKQAGLRGSAAMQGHFSKMGVGMWPSRAEQIFQTAQKFSSAQLQRGLELIFAADRDLRSARPDDRIIMEQFVFRLTKTASPKPK